MFTMNLFHKIQWLPLCFCLVLILTAGRGVSADTAYLQSQDIPLESVSPETMAQGALLDTLYYNYEKWIPAFKREISRFESRPQTLETQLQLLKYYFYLGGLFVEFTHTLVVTNKFKVPELGEEYIAWLNKAKHTAQTVLRGEGISPQQEAEAYFFLGAAEGYLGILEYGEGNYLSAFSNGFQADGHLEKAVRLNPNLADAYLGLGVYRYASSRVGGLGNLIMQFGKDLRLVGIKHVERILQSQSLTMPLAFKTLIWFYISEQINPRNADLPPDHPLSVSSCKKRALDLIKEVESRYFKNPPDPEFIGSKDLALMKAIQNILDGDYKSSRDEFEKIARISRYLRDKKGYKINPKFIRTAEEGVVFSEINQAAIKDQSQPDLSLCAKIHQQISFLESGESIVPLNSRGVRREIQSIFYNRLLDLSRQKNCGNVHPVSD